MRFLADEHVKSSYLTALRSEGYEVVRVVDMLGEGSGDPEVLAYATEQRLVVLTNDTKDFTREEGHRGVIIVPQGGVTAGEIAAAINRIDRLVGDIEDIEMYVTDRL